MLERKLPVPTLLLLISFASVNAVLFTPALPNITHFFNITSDVAQASIWWYLIGYTIGQLFYGPLANRFGRKPALFFGVILQILSSIICFYANSFFLLVLGRFFLAFGAGAGLKMTFTLVNETYTGTKVNSTISYLMMAFAITPGLGVALGGILNQHFGWQSTFLAGGIYGVILLPLIYQLPETLLEKDKDAFHLHHLIEGYRDQFKNIQMLIGGIMMGLCTSFVYVFAAVAPFIAIKQLHMTSAQYGISNMLPPIGIILGSLSSGLLVRGYSVKNVIKFGILVMLLGIFLMYVAIHMKLDPIISLFLTMIVIYFGIAHINSNASSEAMISAKDKAHGSAVLNFLNMGTATLATMLISLFPIHHELLPLIYLVLGMMITLFDIFFNKYLKTRY